MDSKAFVKKYNLCQRMGRPSHRDDLPLHPVKALQPFEKWEVDFLGLIAPVARHSQARYIITAIEYFTSWAEAILVKDCTAKTTGRFIFENIISRFGCPEIMTSDQGTHFINATIRYLLENFMVQHHKSIPYHPQANGTIEAFNKILEKGLMNIFNAE